MPLNQSRFNDSKISFTEQFPAPLICQTLVNLYLVSIENVNVPYSRTKYIAIIYCYRCITRLILVLDPSHDTVQGMKLLALQKSTMI